MPIDRPREPEEETPRPTRGSFDRLPPPRPPVAEVDPTVMPADSDGKPVQNVGYRLWYRDYGKESPDAPAPRDSTPMDQMERRGTDPPIAGVLTKPVDSALKDAERVWEGMSGKEGPAERVGWQALRLPDHRVLAIKHVEAHAAAVMREQEMEEAVLYLSRRPCPYDRLPDGTEDYDATAGRFSCDRLLSRMLPPDAKLTVYAPGGWWKVYHGMEKQG
jgi:hypothetical protein